MIQRLSNQLKFQKRQLNSNFNLFVCKSVRVKSLLVGDVVEVVGLVVVVMLLVVVVGEVVDVEAKK